MIMVKKNIIQFGNRTENVIFHFKKIFIFNSETQNKTLKQEM